MSSDRKTLGRLLGAVAGTGLLIGTAVVALGGSASAGQPTLVDQSDAAVEAEYLNDAEYLDGIELEGEAYPAEEFSEAEAALFEEYDQCLADAGVPIFETWIDEDLEGEVAEYELTEGDIIEFDDVYEGDISELEDGWVDSEWSDEDWEAFDAEHAAAFESCDPILDDLEMEFFVADGMDGELYELSPEDEALFEQHDECLIEAGVPMYDFDDDVDVDADIDVSAEDLEAAFNQCDPILEGLSDDVFSESVMIDDIEGLEAAFEEFDQCLVDAGIDIHETDDTMAFTVTDADIEIFETCEIIFDALEDELFAGEVVDGEVFEGEVLDGEIIESVEIGED